MRSDLILNAKQVGDEERKALAEALDRLLIRPTAAAQYEGYGAHVDGLGFDSTLDFLDRYLLQGLESAKSLFESPPEGCPYEGYGIRATSVGPSEGEHDEILIGGYVSSTWEGEEMNYGEVPLVICRTAADEYFLTGPSLEEVRSWPDRWRIDEGNEDDDFDTGEDDEER